MDEEDQEALKDHFGSGENFGIGSDNVADALFGMEDGDTLLEVFEGLNEGEKDALVKELYDCGIIAENEDD